MTEPQPIGEPTAAPKPTTRSRKVIATTLALAIVGTAGAVGATQAFKVKADGKGKAELSCSGGIVSLGQILSEASPTFVGDPPTEIDRLKFDLDGNDYAESDEALGENFSYRIEDVHFASHTGTHLDAPSHFIEEGARSVDQLDASEFVWPSYIIDVRDRLDESGVYNDDTLFVTIDDIRNYEKQHGKISRGSLVIIHTGLGEQFYERNDDGSLQLDEDGNPITGTGYYADAPGFSGDAVQWMIEERQIEAIGSDTFGPDSSADPEFSATYTILAKNGVAIPGLANLDEMSVKGDIVIAAPVRLFDGSAFQVNPLACLGSSNDKGNDKGNGKD